MTPADLRALSAPEAAKLPPLLHALWHDAHGDWNGAHSILENNDTPEGARVHAYLHRKEGNHFNASYWYRRAHRLEVDMGRPIGTPAFSGSLDDEWTSLATFLLTIYAPS